MNKLRFYKFQFNRNRHGHPLVKNSEQDHLCPSGTSMYKLLQVEVSEIQNRAMFLRVYELQISSSPRDYSLAPTPPSDVPIPGSKRVRAAAH